MRLLSRFRFLSLPVFLPLLILLISNRPLRADSIDYQATDLGAGQWEYTYTLNGFDLTNGELIAIYFDLSDYSNLDPSPVSPSSDWYLQVFQPDPGIPAPGELDLVAQVDSPTLADTFTEDFTYLGTGTPGAQPFTLYDADFNDVEDEETTPALSPVPEPPTLLLVGSVLALALLFRSQFRKRATVTLLCLLGFAGLDAHAQLQVIGRTLVSSTRVSLTDYNYAYTLQVENLGAAATNVTAVATSFAPATTIVQGNLTFPNIPAGGTATSTNTYTIQQNRTVAINQSLIRFAFSAISTPVANAGPDTLITALNNNLLFGAPNPAPYCCLLNGGGSYDPYGLPLTYTWSIVSTPANSAAQIYQGNPALSFVGYFDPDLPGDYTLQLVVNNGYNNSAPSYVHMSTIAVPPRADAGWNQTIQAGQTVQLDGTHSVNPMNRPLTYAWSFICSPAGSDPVLSNPASPRPTFVARLAGTYTLQLEVTDGALTSKPVTVTYSTGNTPPRADAGPDMHIAENSYGFLSANRSTDVNGDFLTYRWAELSGLSTLTLAPVPNPDFKVDGSGCYHIQLFVNDGTSESIATQIICGDFLVQLPGSEAPPWDLILPAFATVDPPGTNPGAVTVDGTLTLTSDLIQNSYWNLREAPAGSTAQLTPAGNGMTATITPDENGLYIAQFYTTSWGNNSYPAAVSFLTQGGLPVANPGSTQFGLWTAPTLHTLNGSGSWDPDGRALTYQWSLLSSPLGSGAALSSTTAVSPTFTADVNGTYIFQLVVNNGVASSAPATVSVISKDSVAPTAYDVNVRFPWEAPCIPVSLEASDPLLDPYQYSAQLNSLPTYGFLSNLGSGGLPLDIWGTDGIPADDPKGVQGADTFCYIPFSSTFVGNDSFLYSVNDLGYPSGCRTPGNYCIAPKTSKYGTVAIQIFQVNQ
jgi:hypothetical protein